MDALKIREIRIVNFRSLLGEHLVKLGNGGKNLFIFGENGSGKSSFCRALNNFFEATDQRRTTLHISNFENRHLSVDQRGSAEISIVLTDEQSFKFSKNGHSGDLDFLQQTRRMKGFLEYKNLLPIYLYGEKNRNNLFRFFVEGPFANLRNPKTKKQISTEWVSDKKIKLPRAFYEGVFQIAEELKDEVNMLLAYFDSNMQVNFKTSKTWTTGELYLEVILNGDYTVNNYGEYLNEARLVGLAISIYLAVTLKYKKEHEAENKKSVKILILDDVFIGMDMSNRLPLLKIIQEKFDDYQIFITTYDEYWYKLAQFYLESNAWKFIRVYTTTENGTVFKSKIQDDELDDYVKKAKHYFNLNDFAACANYQRKAFEEKIKNILPDNLLSNAAEDGMIKRNDKFQINFNNFLQFLSDCGLDSSIFNDFKLYSKLILNPLSHDNAGSPVFRREVESVFGILSRFDEIKNIILKKVSIEENPTLVLAIKDNENTWHNYKFRILDNLRRVSQSDKIGYAPCRLQLFRYKRGTEEWIDVDEQVEEMKVMYRKLCEKHQVETANFADEYKNNRGVCISQMDVYTP